MNTLPEHVIVTPFISYDCHDWEMRPGVTWREIVLQDIIKIHNIKWKRILPYSSLLSIFDENVFDGVQHRFLDAQSLYLG